MSGNLFGSGNDLYFLVHDLGNEFEGDGCTVDQNITIKFNLDTNNMVIFYQLPKHKEVVIFRKVKKAMEQWLKDKSQ